MVTFDERGIPHCVLSADLAQSWRVVSGDGDGALWRALTVGPAPNNVVLAPDRGDRRMRPDQARNFLAITLT